MIIKAVFFIAAIALFAPHEPNVGYGTPAGAAPSTSIVATVGCKALAIARLPCSPPTTGQTKSGPDTFAQTRESFLEKLQAAKADLQANGH